nr:unnamed protein product [Callosobruchus analis]
MSDLRPISLLYIISKLLEKVVYQQILNYVNEHNITPSHQSGFRKNYSTTSALLNLVDDIIRSRDKKMATILLSLDYSSAFNCLNHILVCAKLWYEYYSFNNNYIQFFEYYLKDREQIVLANNMPSPARLASGVPQGSVLGPPLFLSYMADLSKKLSYSHIQTYADDTQMLFHFDQEHSNEAAAELN